MVALKEDETFVTQRGGKIIQVPVIHNESISKFETRKTLQSTLLLHKKKEMEQIQSLLEKKRTEFAKRMDECREKQEDLRTKQRQLRDRVTKFEKFLKENDAKKQRANVKAMAERKLREQKEQELLALQKQLSDEHLKAEHIVRMIKKYQVYEKYLQSVVDILPSDYLDVNEPHINDVLMRHKTLVETNDDLIVMLQQYQDNFETEAQRFAELVKEKNDLILVYNSTLGTQQKKFDKLKQECAYMEQKQEERDNTGKERMRLIGETKMAINNLHDRLGLNTHMQLSKVIANSNTVTQQQNLPALTQTATANLPSNTNTPGLGQIPLSEKGNAHYEQESAKALTDKLHAIMERFIDLQQISQKAEHFMQQERAEKGKKTSDKTYLNVNGLPATATGWVNERASKAGR
ncbi:hypothetical protein HK098_000354 [Nowakowskiella sp. JEL0407]|nr:hypothetical protein HK098_000354 [Nowakowskiella sp. JEL0407]